jgi:hypothetical protein
VAVKIHKNETRLSERDLKNFEECVGTKLPSEYRSFLSEYNGGKAEGNVFDVICHSKEYENTDSVRVFYAITGTQGGTTLIEEYAQMRERLPIGILPIAEAECGNMVCISVVRESFGYVYYWDHELENDYDETLFSPLVEIAPDFDTFLRLLNPFSLDDVEIKEEDVLESWVDPDFLETLKNK